MLTLRTCLLWLTALVSVSAHAIPVEYRFTGELTGDFNSLFFSQTLVDTPFQISIFADTKNVSSAHTGAGSRFFNNSATAIWSINGFGSATSSDVQIYTIPGLARIGFGWNGKVILTNNDQPAQTIIYFNGNEIATNPNYSRLSNDVTPISVDLQTALKNPPNMLPEYSTSIYFDGVGPLTLKNLASVEYAVIAVPEPSNLALFVAGIGFILAAIRRHHSVS